MASERQDRKISKCRVGGMAFLSEKTARAKALRAGTWARTNNDKCIGDTDLK